MEKHTKKSHKTKSSAVPLQSDTQHTDDRLNLVYIEGYQHRGQCTPCDTAEDMEHILTTCRAGHAAQIWNLAKELWPYEATQWPDINIETIWDADA